MYARCWIPIHLCIHRYSPSSYGIDVSRLYLEASPGSGAAAPLLRLLRAGVGQPGAAQRGGAELCRACETPGGTDPQLPETPGLGPVWTMLDPLDGLAMAFFPHGHG